MASRFGRGLVVMMNPQLRLLNKINFYAGIFPCRLINGELRVSHRACLYSLIVLKAYICINLAAFFLLLQRNVEVQTPFHVILYVLAKSSFVYRAVILVYNSKSNQTINNYVKKIKEIQRYLQFVGIRHAYRRTSHTVMELVVFLSLCGIVIPVNLTFKKLLVHSLTTLLRLIEGFTFWCAIALINSFLQELSACFENITNDLVCIGGTVYYDGKVLKLQMLSWAHGELCKEAQSINEAFKLQTLTIIIFQFFSFILTLYVVVNLSNENKFKWKEVYFQCVFGLYRFHLLLCLVKCCNSVVKKSKEFNNLLYQLMLNDQSKDIICDQKLRLHIAMKREVVLTACGFFNLDYTLVQSMISSATTYFVILIQFGEQATNDASFSTPLPNATLAAS